jgi:hypothetical protein
MKQRYFRGLIRQSMFFVIVALACAALVGAAGFRQARRKDQQAELRRKQHAAEQALLRAWESLNINNIPFKSKAPDFRLVSIERTPGGAALLLTMRNDYEKGITAYKIATGSPSRSVDSLLHDALTAANDFTIAPGSTSEVIVDFNDPDLEINGITLGAVAFDDGSFEGEAASIREIRQFRQGQLIQLERTLALLGKPSSGAALLESLSTSQLDLQSTPMESQLPYGSMMADGAKAVRLSFTGYLGQIRANLESGNESSGMPELIEYAHRRVAELHASVEGASMNK